MAEFTRFAIYWAPPAGSALAGFGATWLGWDVETGQARAHPDLPGIDVAAITHRPRKYGFHGTLKAPFRLVAGVDAGEFGTAVGDLAARHAAFYLPPLTLRRLGRFLALVPSAPSDDLADLAGECVQQLERFRRPPDAADLARRRASGLTAQQGALLARWGYPYVLDEFRFHLTLTGPLDPEMADQIAESISVMTAAHCREPVAVHEICLFGERMDGRFQIVDRFPLTG